MKQQEPPRRREQINAIIARVVKEDQKTLEILAAHDRVEVAESKAATAPE